MNIRCHKCGFENRIDRETCIQCGFMLEPDLFISYSRADYVDENGIIKEGNIISEIKEVLIKNQISYWFDEEGIYSGQEFASLITSAIRRSKIFLFVSSTNSNKSKWTSNEISIAIEFSKPIIPFKIDESKYNDSIMMKIVSYDYIEYKQGANSLSKLIRALKHYLPTQIQNNCENTYIVPDGVKGATIMLDMGNEVVEHVLSSGLNKVIAERYGKEVEQTFQNLDIGEKGIDGLDNEDCIIREQDLEVNISNSSVPYIVFIGPPNVGKTSVIDRMAQYIDESTCHFVNDAPFFWKEVLGCKLPESIKSLSMKVISKSDKSDEREEKAYFIDTRGTIIFKEYGDVLPSYLKQIAYSKNPKLWVIMLEQGWSGFSARENYIQSIEDFRKRFMSSSDKVIFLINKVDNSPFIDGRDNVKMGLLLRDIEQTYPNIFKPFLRKSRFLQILKSKYTCDILPFSAGTLSGEIFVPASDCYPKILWDVIDDFIKEPNSI